MTAVVGRRRAGKTTFVHQLRRERLSQGVPRTHVPHVHFKDERLAGLHGRHLGFLINPVSWPQTLARHGCP